MTTGGSSMSLATILFQGSKTYGLSHGMKKFISCGLYVLPSSWNPLRTCRSLGSQISYIIAAAGSHVESYNIFYHSTGWKNPNLSILWPRGWAVVPLAIVLWSVGFARVSGSQAGRSCLSRDTASSLTLPGRSCRNNDGAKVEVLGCSIGSLQSLPHTEAGLQTSFYAIVQGTIIKAPSTAGITREVPALLELPTCCSRISSEIWQE